MKTLVTLLVLASVGTAFAQDPVDYIDKQYKFSLKYPSNWEKSQPYNSIFMISERDVKDWTDKSSFDIEVRDTLSSLRIFCLKWANTIVTGDIFKQFKVLSKKDTIFKSFPAIEYTCTALLVQTKKTVQWRSTFFIKGDKVYKVTLSSFPDKFDAAMAVTKVIFDSFGFM